MANGEEEVFIELEGVKEPVRVVAKKGLSTKELIAIANAQHRGETDVETKEDLQKDVGIQPDEDFDEEFQDFLAKFRSVQGSMDANNDQAERAQQETAINQARATGQMIGGIGGGALSFARQAGDTGNRAAQSFGKNFSQGMQSPLGTLPGGPQNTPGQKWAAKVVGQPGLQMRPDDYSVSQAAQRYQRAMPSGKVSGPAAKKYGLGPLDIGRQISTAPAKPSGLEMVTQQFGRLANSGPVSFMARKVLPPVAGAYGLGELAAAAQEGVYSESPDPVRTGLSAASGLGGILSMFPGTAPVGIPMAGAAEIIKALRDYNANRPQITEEDMQRMRAEAGGLQPYVAP